MKSSSPPTSSRLFRKTTWFVLAICSLLVGTVLAFTQTAHAATAKDPVGGGLFQLAGAADTNPAYTGDSWDRVCYQVNQAAGSNTCSTVGQGTTGATAVAWQSVPLGYYNFTGGGSKDPSDIPKWAWSNTGGLPGKDSLLNGFAAEYATPVSPTCPTVNNAPTCKVLYYGSDRWDNSGDAQQGFWFFQNKVSVVTNATNTGGTFTGVHKNGDILLVSDFSVGGTTSTIDVYEWLNGGLTFLSGGTNENCNTPGPVTFCGIVNPADGTPSPWPFSDKKGSSTFRAGELYEGGLNLSMLPGTLASECFSSFDSETRSSTSPTATLKSFIVGNFGNCSATTKSQPQNSSNTAVTSEPITAAGSVQVKDHAVVAANPGGLQVTPTGNVNFSLCGPIATGTCTTGGVADPANPEALVAGNPGSASADSSLFTITSAGRYCFRADYLGDSNYPPGANGVSSSDSGPGECFTVTPLTPTLTTQASAGPVTLGTAIDDSATLGGTANEPGTPVINPTTAGSAAKGTITWNLYDTTTDTTCASSLETSVVNVTGNNTYSASAGTLSGSLGTGPTIVPKAAGTYEWIANYSPSAADVNTLANVANTCSSAGQSTETVVVSPNTPIIHTSASAPPSGGGVPLGTAIDDTATLTNTYPEPGGKLAQGQITFSLYGPSDSACAGPVIETSVVNVNGDGSYKASTGTLSGTLGTTSITPTVAGTYNWTASYSGDLPNTTAVSEPCGGTPNSGDVESSLVIQLQPTITTAQNFVPNDSAEITVASGAGTLAGTVDFQLFVNNPTCSTSVSAPAYDSKPLDINGTGTTGTGLDRVIKSSNTMAYSTSSTTFSWLVTYTSSNQGHKNVVSNCSEQSSITINN